MKHLFVPYALSSVLADRGFDEPVFATYNRLSTGNIDFLPKKFGRNTMQTLIPAPTYQQVFDWFMVKHGPALKEKYGIVPHFTIIQNMMTGKRGITYEEAQKKAVAILLEAIS